MTHGTPQISRTSHPSPRARTLRLRIVDVTNGQIKVLLMLPVSLVSVAQRLGAQLLPPDSSIEALTAQAEQHGIARLEWVDPAHEERLELTIA
ncbi:MAG: hypothetical protein JOZ51_15600 [Chloroflexi bacterium]|nr:hypothetical protein [Chloroflexota bacterium]